MKRISARTIAIISCAMILVLLAAGIYWRISIFEPTRTSQTNENAARTYSRGPTSTNETNVEVESNRVGSSSFPLESSDLREMVESEGNANAEGDTHAANDALKVDVFHPLYEGMVWLDPPDDVEVIWSAAAPNNEMLIGYLIAVLGGSGLSHHLMLVDLSTGRRIEIDPPHANGSGKVTGFRWFPDGSKLVISDLYTTYERKPGDDPFAIVESGIRTDLLIYDVTDESLTLLTSFEPGIDSIAVDSEGNVLAVSTSVSSDRFIASIHTFGEGREPARLDVEIGRPFLDPQVLPRRNELWFSCPIEAGGRSLPVAYTMNYIDLSAESPEIIQAHDNGRLVAWDDSEQRMLFYETSQSGDWKDWQVSVMERSTGAVVALFPASPGPQPVGFSHDGQSVYLYGAREGELSSSEYFRGSSNLGLFELGL